MTVTGCITARGAAPERIAELNEDNPDRAVPNSPVACV